jgi:hypothetical protein
MAKNIVWMMAGIIVLVGGMTAAFAATASVNSETVSGGLGTVAACDPAPSWSYAFAKNASGQVTSVQITNIAPSCAGGSMQVSLAGSTLSSVGTPTEISTCGGTCSVTVPFSTSLLFPADISAANALIVGP